MTRATDGMPEGFEGIVIGWYTDRPHEVLINLWDGGPLRVPRDAVELVERPEPPGHDG